MPSWEALEARFARIHDPSRSIRLVRQNLAGEITYEIEGVNAEIAKRAFEALSAVAGAELQALERRLRREVVPSSDTASEHWYKALFALPRLDRHGMVGYFTNEKGENTGSLTTRAIDNVPQASAVLCLQLEALSVTTTPIDITSDLGGPRYAGVRAHLTRARLYLSDAFSDYPNAIKEAVCAVEAVAQLVVKDDSATLGEAAKQLRQKDLFPAALTKVLEGLWGYSSEEDGVRHGSPRESMIARSDAQALVELCEGCVRLLLARDAA